MCLFAWCRCDFSSSKCTRITRNCDYQLAKWYRWHSLFCFPHSHNRSNQTKYMHSIHTHTQKEKESEKDRLRFAVQFVCEYISFVPGAHRMPSKTKTTMNYTRKNRGNILVLFIRRPCCKNDGNETWKNLYANWWFAFCVGPPASSQCRSLFSLFSLSLALFPFFILSANVVARHLSTLSTLSCCYFHFPTISYFLLPYHYRVCKAFSVRWKRTNRKAEEEKIKKRQ